MQSVPCAPGSRRTYCSLREGHGPTLTPLSHALKALRFDTLDAEYNYKFSAVTHGTYLTTAGWWVNVSQRAVRTFNRQGSLAAWSAQQMFLGIVSDITWTTSSRSPACADFSGRTRMGDVASATVGAADLRQAFRRSARSDSERRPNGDAGAAPRAVSSARMASLRSPFD